MFPVDAFNVSFITSPPQNGTANSIYSEFIVKLEQFLHTNRTEFNFTALWPQTKPANATDSLQDLLNTTYVDLISFDQVSLVREPFFQAYAAQNNGQLPFIDPVVASRWNWSATRPADTRDVAIANKTIFMQWFGSQVVLPDPDTCADSLFLYPRSKGTPMARNAYRQ